MFSCLPKQENHSLDSDEEDVDLNADQIAGVENVNIKIQQQKKAAEDEVADENVLHEDDIEGQEDETIREDEGITVTPFNLKDELEEG